MVTSRKGDRATAPAKWRHFAPLQERGFRTQERIVDTVERLLETRPFDAISIGEIVNEAQTTSGSFYARFESKEAVLPFIYRRYQEELEEEIRRAAAEVDWKCLSLRSALRALVSLAMTFPEAKPWRMKAVLLFARTNPEAIPPEARERSGRVFGLVTRALAHHADVIRHQDRNRSLSFVSFVIVTAARERALFPEAPLVSALPHDDAEFEEELVNLTYAFLTTPRSAEEVE